MQEIEKAIVQLFIDSSNRPKKTPIHESAIEVRLEEKFVVWKVRHVLKKLEKMGYIISIMEETRNTKKAKFYFSTKLIEKLSENEIKKKIQRLVYWIDRYSDPKITRMLGNHLHSLVVGELVLMDSKLKKVRILELIKIKNGKSLEKVWI